MINNYHGFILIYHDDIGHNVSISRSVKKLVTLRDLFLSLTTNSKIQITNRWYVLSTELQIKEKFKENSRKM